MLPVWSFHGLEDWCMIGYHAVPVIADAYVKGIRGFDADKALKAMIETANYGPYDGIAQYRELGYVPIDEEGEAASKTLEYASMTGPSRAWRRRWTRPMWRRPSTSVPATGAMPSTRTPASCVRASAMAASAPVRPQRQRLWHRLHRRQRLAVFVVRAAGCCRTGSSARWQRQAARAPGRCIQRQGGSVHLRAHGRHHRPDRLACARQRAQPPRGLPVFVCRSAVAHPGAVEADHGHSMPTALMGWPATMMSARCRPGTCSPRWALSGGPGLEASSVARSCLRPRCACRTARRSPSWPMGWMTGTVGNVSLNGKPLQRTFLRHDEILAASCASACRPSRTRTGGGRTRRRHSIADDAHSVIADLESARFTVTWEPRGQAMLGPGIRVNGSRAWARLYKGGGDRQGQRNRNPTRTADRGGINPQGRRHAAARSRPTIASPSPQPSPLLLARRSVTRARSASAMPVPSSSTHLHALGIRCSPRVITPGAAAP